MDTPSIIFCFCILTSLLALLDYKTKKIPNYIMLLAYIASGYLALFQIDRILEIAIWFLFLWGAVLVIFYMFVGSFGGADAKFLPLLAVLPINVVIVTSIALLVIACNYFAYRSTTKGLKFALKEKVQLFPFLTVSLWVAFFFHIHFLFFA